VPLAGVVYSIVTRGRNPPPPPPSLFILPLRLTSDPYTHGPTRSPIGCRDKQFSRLVIGGFLLGIKLHLQMNSRDKGYNSSSGWEREERRRLIYLSLSLCLVHILTHHSACFPYTYLYCLPPVSTSQDKDTVFKRKCATCFFGATLWFVLRDQIYADTKRVQNYRSKIKRKETI